MARVYSTQLLSVRGLQGAAAFTVEPGQVCILRDVDVYWGGGVNLPSVHVMGADGQTIVEFHPSGAPGAVFPQTVTDALDSHSWHWEGRQVIEAGQSFSVRSDGDSCDVTVSGYLLDAP